MSNTTRQARRLAISVLAVASLAMTGAGVAAAAPSTSGHHLRHATGEMRRHLCQNDSSRLALSAHRQAQFATQTAAYASLEASATKAGKTVLASYWAQVVSHRQADSDRQHANLTARTSRAATTHGLVNGNCS